MKNHQQKNRNHQPRQNQQPQRIPTDLMKRMTVLGADINITEGVTIPVPRDEYDELLYCSALVDILHMLYETGGKYTACDLLDQFFQDLSGEKEDK